MNLWLACLSVIVATDVAARGLDIESLEAVINLDISPDPQVHANRIGRTARADQTGLALSLASMDEKGLVGRPEQFLGISSSWHPLSDLSAGSDKALEPPMATLQILDGRKEKIRPGDGLGSLTAEVSLRRGQVGKINAAEFATFVAVQRDIASKAMTKLNAGKVKGRSVKVRLVQRVPT